MIRVLTTAPILALVMLTLLKIYPRDVYDNTSNYVFAVFFLTILPLLAYPLQPFIPKFKDKGREGQRNLAIVMAVVGYVGGIVYSMIIGAKAGLLMIFLTYLISGVLIAVFNKGLKIRASGHACGVAGPIAMLVYFYGAVALWGIVVMALVVVSSLLIKRHKISDLILGSIISVAATFMSYGLVQLVA